MKEEIKKYRMKYKIWNCPSVIERTKFARQTRREVSFGDKIKDEDLEQERYKVSSRPIADHPEAVSAGVPRHHLPRPTNRNNTSIFQPRFFLLPLYHDPSIHVSLLPSSFERENKSRHK